METKPSDIFYCGVDKEKIKNANPKLNLKNINILYEWIKERYKIHLKKDIERASPPWTEDQILKKYRFTNVRREHDKETEWLIYNICKNVNISYENKIMNIILFRLFNKSETLKITGLIDFRKFKINLIKEKIRLNRIKNPGYIYFSNAFYTSGPKRVANLLFKDEKDSVVKIILLVKRYFDSKITNKIKDAKNQTQVCGRLKELPGIGVFLAYQTFIDLTYIKEFPFSENEFVVAGPGCKKGLGLIFEDFDSLSCEEALFWFRDNQNKIFSKFNYSPEKLFSDLLAGERYLNIMSLENCMCEISKYIRTLNGKGRPRIRYKIRG